LTRFEVYSTATKGKYSHSPGSKGDVECVKRFTEQPEEGDILLEDLHLDDGITLLQ